MICPNCGKEIILAPRVYRNLETYHIGGGSVLAVSECCGIGYKVNVETSFNLRPYDGPEKKDDWGDSIKTYKPKK